MEVRTKEEHREKAVVTMRQLLECGGHFGHQTKRWNPKMKRYIFTARNGIHVIDLQQSIKLIKVAYNVVKEVIDKNGSILFVGTKKQAQEAIAAEAIRCGMPYVHHRWLGGTLTNNMTIRQSINKLKRYQKTKEEGGFDALSNKEAARKLKSLAKLSYYLDGLKDMKVLPSLVFVVDTKKEQLAVQEANKLKIPIIGIVDTNADPTEVQYPIPANDDAIRAIKLICSIIAQAVLASRPQVTEIAPDAQNQEENKEEGAVEKVAVQEQKEEIVAGEETKATDTKQLKEEVSGAQKASASPEN